MTREIQCPIREQGLCVAVVQVTAQAKSLIDWQKSQNGHLGQIDEKLQKLEVGIAQSAGRLQWWLIGLLASVVVAVALLAANLALKRF